jgi:ABC-type sulfate transport system permease subunit
MVGAFSVAALLCLLAVVTLAAKAALERLQPQLSDAIAPQRVRP